MIKTLKGNWTSQDIGDFSEGQDSEIQLQLVRIFLSLLFIYYYFYLTFSNFSRGKRNYGGQTFFFELKPELLVLVYR